MVATHESAPSLLADYQLRLPAFEGPLDVLLHLIERSELTITDISLALVTDQFLTYVQTLSDAPPDLLADFVAMGARLTVLKSRSLLPRPTIVEDEPEPSDLARQLARYRQLRDAAMQLQARQLDGASCFATSESNARTPIRLGVVRLAHYEASALPRSLRRRLASLPRPAEVLHQRPIVSLREMIQRIVALPRRGHPRPFSSVLTQCETRAEMATAFLAVLVLVRRQLIGATQKSRFGAITLHIPEWPATPESLGSPIGNERRSIESDAG